MKVFIVKMKVRGGETTDPAENTIVVKAANFTAAIAILTSEFSSMSMNDVTVVGEMQGNTHVICGTN